VKESFQWYLGFSQLVSRFTNGTPAAWVVIDKIATLVLAEFLDQSIWLFISTLNSTESNRVARGERTIRALLNKTLPTHRLRVDSCRAMATHLLELVTDGRKDTESSLSMSKEYPELFKTAPSPLIIPMQRSLAANVLLTSGNDQSYKPFPVEVPTFVRKCTWPVLLLRVF
jgi:serine/threonine-protein kinase ATR